MEYNVSYIGSRKVLSTSLGLLKQDLKCIYWYFKSLLFRAKFNLAFLKSLHSWKSRLENASLSEVSLQTWLFMAR